MAGLLSWPGAARAQQARTPAAPPVAALVAPGDQPFRITASATALCAGGSAVLTATGGAGVAGPYTWTPNQDLASAGPSNKVVVAPLQTTTYTVQGYAINGQPVTASVTVTVQTDCCQQSMPGPAVVELQNVYGGLTGSPNNPFDAAAPGTRFHVSGNLYLNNDDYTLPAGSVLLMDAGASILLDDAILTLNGATITAGCDDMWGGIVVAEHNHGFYTRASGTLRSRLMHSYEGVVLEEGSSTPPPPFGIQDTDFLHNRQGLSLTRDVHPAAGSDYLRNCFFDSNPQQFKAPWRYQDDQHRYWALRHIYLVGDISLATVTNNRLQNALFGVYSPALGVQPRLTASGNVFDNCLLAGIYGYDIGGYTGGRAVALAANTFYFPTAYQLPATEQLQEATNGFVPGPGKTFGLYLPGAAVDLQQNQFIQGDSSAYASYNYAAYRTEQTGAEVGVVEQIEGNRFYLLHNGVTQHFDNYVAAAGLTSAVKDNRFISCATGLRLRGAAPGGPLATFVTCNTFNRGQQRPGTAYGIYFEAGTNGYLDDPRSAGATLKNRFLGATAGGQFYHLFSVSGATDYNTFSDYVPQLVVNANVTVPGNGPRFSNNLNCHNDGFDAGIQQLRNANKGMSYKALPEVQQNVPNPVSGLTRVAYTTSVSAKNCELVVLDNLTGKVVLRQGVVPGNSAVDVDLRFLSNGIYHYRIIADGMPSETRHLLLSN